MPKQQKYQKWDDMYERLITYEKTYGNCLVPRKGDTKQLGMWVKEQRQQYNKHKMIYSRYHKLKSIGFEFGKFSKETKQWNDMYNRLVIYEKRHGHCLVPRAYYEEEEEKGNFSEDNVGDNSSNSNNNKIRHRLGDWVANQRKRKDKLSDDRLQKLNKIYFVWSVRDFYNNSNTAYEGKSHVVEKENYSLARRQDVYNNSDANENTTNSDKRKLSTFIASGVTTTNDVTAVATDSSVELTTKISTFDKLADDNEILKYANVDDEMSMKNDDRDSSDCWYEV